MKIKKIIFNLKNSMLRHKVMTQNQTLIKNQKQSQEEIKKLQLEKLKKLFKHAKNHVPYYMNKYKEIDVESIKTFEDWEKIPILTKEDVRQYTQDLMATNISKKRFNKVTTGGSTGVPLTIYHDKKFPLEVLGWRVLNWWGVEPSDNIAFIYRKVRTGFKANLNALMWYPTKRLFLDASLITEESMKSFYTKLTKNRPSILQGYVGGVFEFAKFCQKNNFTLDFIKAVWVTSSPLSEPSRNLMESVFNAPVYDQYGCGEVYWLASECSKKHGLHVLSDVRYLEIINSEQKSSPIEDYGDICITDLENYAFPLIRYINGDRGRYLKKRCSCGVPFPLIDKIKGRVTDVLRFESGKVIAGDYLTTIFDDYPDAVEAFQVYQNKDYSLILYCVLGTNNSAYDICLEKLNSLATLLKNEVPISLKIVDKLQHDEGKTRFIISEIKS